MDPVKTGKIISEKRKELGLTQKALAEKVGVTGKAVSKWERGISFPDITVLIPLSESLGVSLNDLLKGELMETKNEPDGAVLPAEGTENENVLASTIAHYSDEKKRNNRKLVVMKVIAVVAIFILAGSIVQLKTKQTITEYVNQDLYNVENLTISKYSDILEDVQKDNASLNYIDLHMLNSYGGIWPGVKSSSEGSFEEGDLGARVLVRRLESTYKETTKLYGGERIVNKAMVYEALVNFTLSTLDEVEYQFKDCYVTITREELQEKFGIDDFAKYRTDEEFTKLLKFYKENSMDYEFIGTMRML